jgi:hypothetical protein
MQRHCGEKSRETKTMVAMKMTDKNVCKPLEFQFHTAHLNLGALATVYHHEPVAEVYNLT